MEIEIILNIVLRRRQVIARLLRKEDKATEENKPTNLPYSRFKKMGKDIIPVKQDDYSLSL